MTYVYLCFHLTAAVFVYFELFLSPPAGATIFSALFLIDMATVALPCHVLTAIALTSQDKVIPFVLRC